MDEITFFQTYRLRSQHGSGVTVSYQDGGEVGEIRKRDVGGKTVFDVRLGTDELFVTRSVGTRATFGAALRLFAQREAEDAARRAARGAA